VTSGFSLGSTVRRSIARPSHPSSALEGWDNVESRRRSAISAASIMGFRLTVISPYPFMDASASLRVLHQMGGGDLRDTARFGIDNS
jgi:hypothetical protein